MELSISKIASVCLAVISFVMVIQETFFETFFRWAYLGGFLDFVVSHYNLLASSLVVLICVKWVKNIYAVGIIWILVYVILVFVF
jgi:hypothetical protein